MSWLSAPEEVQKYYATGPHKALSVQPLPSYIVKVSFDDGSVKTYDYSDKLTGVLSVLQEPSLFAQAYIDDTNSIAWDTPKGHLDLSADSVYIYGKSLSEERL